MPKWLSTAGNRYSAGGFSSNPISVRVCADAEQFLIKFLKRKVSTFGPLLWNLWKKFIMLTQLNKQLTSLVNFLYLVLYFLQCKIYMYKKILVEIYWNL
jgi:hypothetical protein